MAETEVSPLLQGKMGGISTASSIQADGTPLPQAIAHRGYKAAYPENSMAAFVAAVEIGAHAIETDLHMSKDGVVVLSHDATLKRCFGEDKKVAECDWSYLSTLKTLREPQQHMPRLSELLEYLGRPENEAMWLLLDIKTDDDAEDLLRRTAETIDPIPTTRPWKDRIVLGGWNTYYIDLCRKYFPGFAVANIGFLPYAFKYLKLPDVDFNMLQPTLIGPCGKLFMHKVRKLKRKLYVWTVNEEQWMEWSIRKKVDGVITDDPKLFLEVCGRYALGDDDAKNGLLVESGTSAAKRIRQYTTALMFQYFVFFMVVVFWRRVGKLGRRKPNVLTQARVPTAA